MPTKKEPPAATPPTKPAPSPPRQSPAPLPPVNDRYRSTIKHGNDLDSAITLVPDLTKVRKLDR